MDKILALLKSLNPKSIIVSWVKKLAVIEIRKESDLLVQKLQLAVEEQGAQAIDKVIDAAQARTIGIVQNVGPKWAFLALIRAKIADAVQVHGDEIQTRLDEAVKISGPGVIGAIVAQATEVLIAKVLAL